MVQGVVQRRPQGPHLLVVGCDAVTHQSERRGQPVQQVDRHRHLVLLAQRVGDVDARGSGAHDSHPQRPCPGGRVLRARIDGRHEDIVARRRHHWLDQDVTALEPATVPLSVVAREWARIGCIGFGGPPTHISLLRKLCVQDRRWLTSDEFEDGVAATNLLPGPASTQLAILCAWRLSGTKGAVLGGLCFIVPGLVLILGLAAFFLNDPPLWARGIAAGAGAAVAAVAVSAAVGLAPASWRRAADPGARARWVAYAAAGGVVGATAGPYLVLVLIGCGLLEITARRLLPRMTMSILPLVAGRSAASGGPAALTWVALKVGLLSYGGGFVIIPLMQYDAVERYHWMTGGQFLNAVALGQI